MSQQPNPDTPDALRAIRRQIIRSLLLSLSALAVVVIASYAWFAQNSSVGGALGSISAEGSTFELASVGAQGAFDDDTPNQWKIDGEKKSYGDLTVFQTGVNDSVLWRVTNTSNLNNFSDTDGIHPGQEGTLEFYVIPSRTKTMTITFQLELLPLNIDLQEITGNPTLVKLLNGHLLFSYESDSGSSWVPYDTLTFSQTFQAQADTPHLIKLRWRWPYVLSDVSGDSTISSWMKKDPKWFFYNNRGDLPSVDFIKSFKALNECYNNADQYIGEQISGLLLRLTALEG